MISRRLELLAKRTRSGGRRRPRRRGPSRSADASPAAPQSWSDSTSPRSTSSTETSISFARERVADLDRRPFLGRTLTELLAGETLAPPIPSRPVVAP
jgi:hypothetical protein